MLTRFEVINIHSTLSAFVRNGWFGVHFSTPSYGDLKTPRVLQGHGNERRPISSKRAKVPSLVLNKQY